MDNFDLTVILLTITWFALSLLPLLTYRKYITKINGIKFYIFMLTIIIGAPIIVLNGLILMIIDYTLPEEFWEDLHKNGYEDFDKEH